MNSHLLPLSSSSPRRHLAALALASLAAFAGCAATDTPATGGTSKAQPTAQAPGYFRMPLGDFQVTALSDGTLKMPLEKLMSNITAADARKLMDDGFEPTPYEASVNAFLVHTGERLILIDTGAGTLYGPTTGQLVANLRAAGYAPEDIDAVLITHLHKDHSGGLTVDGKRVFPRATIYLDKADRDHRFDAAAEARAPAHQKAMFPESRASLTPYEAAGKVVLYDGVTQLFPGVRTRVAHGHTPGHTLYEIESRGQKMVFTGDIVHAAAVQFPRPEVTIGFDSDAPQAAADRAALFRDLAASRTLVGAAHISFPGFGHVTKGEGNAAYRWVPRPYSRDARSSEIR